MIDKNQYEDRNEVLYAPAPQTSWEPDASFEALRQRARMLDSIRAYFRERDVLEVETPLLSQAATPDVYIDSFVVGSGSRSRYLHTSPEFAMKRLLATGLGDIYQIVHVFRKDEVGRLHNPEFSMLEWYRVGWNLARLIDEVVDLITQAGDAVFKRKKIAIFQLSYRQSFENALRIDPHEANTDDLRKIAIGQGLEVAEPMNRSDWLDLLFSECVAVDFPRDALTVIYDYPADQAALARIKPGIPPLAERFEVFAGPIELANGFHELADAGEQAARFAAENRRRAKQNKPEMPVDQHFLSALQAGLPDCSGVAMGLDRLLMWLGGWSSLQEVIPFTWDRA